MRYRLLLICSILSLLLLVACGSSSTKQTENSNKSSAGTIVQLIDAPEDIQSLYANRCLNCHAIDLSGKMGEPTNLQNVHEKLTYEELIEVITNGRNIMPAFGERLTEDEISALAMWLSKQ